MIRSAMIAVACTRLLAADPPRKLAADKAARIELKRNCTGCHTLEVVRVQRLSRHDWDRELTKMSLMGARITDRKVLLDYLEKNYGETGHHD
jgi:thiazole synthase ThiGH ThiG subunit